MSLLGDLGGVFDILVLTLGLMLSKIPENISSLSIAKNYFNDDEDKLNK
jgi:hypothetical protein